MVKRKVKKKVRASTPPEPEDGYEVELAAAEDYIPEEEDKAKRRSAAAKKAWKARAASGKKALKATEEAISTPPPPRKTLHTPTVVGGSVAVYRRFYKNQELTAEEIEKMDPKDVPTIMPRPFFEPPTIVGAWSSYTMNLGDYNSIKFGARIEAPCYWEERDDCFAVLKEWATQRVEDEVAEVEAELPKAEKPKRRRSVRY